MTTWQELFTPAEHKRLERASPQQRRRIANQLAIALQDMGERVHADSILAEMPAADDLRGVHELLAAVHAIPAADVPAAPTATAAAQAPIMVPYCHAAMKMLADAIGKLTKRGKNDSIDWPATIWHFAQSHKTWDKPGSRLAGRSKWKGLGENAETMKKRWMRAADLGYFEKILAIVPTLPITAEERDALERMCVDGISVGERRAKRGVGVRRPAA